jgi:hypothetical protein
MKSIAIGCAIGIFIWFVGQSINGYLYPRPDCNVVQKKD